MDRDATDIQDVLLLSDTGNLTIQHMTGRRLAFPTDFNEKKRITEMQIRKQQ